MPRIEVACDLPVPVHVAWQALRDVGSHVEWMTDARELEFVGSQRRGIGTRFTCTTAVGPLRTVDEMTITSWVEGRSIGVRHEGVVSGEGTLALAPTGPGGSRVTWTEDLQLPLRLGGRVGGLAAAPVLHLIWRSNLRRLARMLKSGQLPRRTANGRT